MIDKDLASKAIKAALSNGGDYAEVYAEWRRPTGIEIEDGKIEKVLSGTDSGVGIRLIFDNKTAYAYLNDFSPKAVLDAARTLARAVSSSPKEGPDIDLRSRKSGVEFRIINPPAETPIEKKVALCMGAERAARALDRRIRQVTVMYRDSVQKVQIANSDGAFTEDERVSSLAFINVIASDGSVIQTGYESVGGFQGFEIFTENSLEALALKAANRAVMMLSARRAPGGRMPVVVSSEAGGTMIHEAIGHGLEADLAGQGLSAFSGKMGDRVASRLVSVIDDSTLPKKRGSFRFDDEGTPSERTVLVKDGILVGYMFDRLQAMKQSAKTTGNGRRQSYAHRPIPRMTNTFVAPGKDMPEEILRKTEKGLFVKKMGGGQVNTVTGDFVFDVPEAYIIEGGRLAEPVRGATLTGNGPQVLLSIDMVGDDLGFSIGTCGKDSQGVPVSDAMPTLRIPELVVGGEV